MFHSGGSRVIAMKVFDNLLYAEAAERGVLGEDDHNGQTGSAQVYSKLNAV